MGKYRQGIVAVFQDAQGMILMCERSDVPGAWQFPQGGIEKDECPKDAFFREVEEELGNAKCEIISVGDGTTRYEWPKPKKERLGQEHTWFLARYKKNEKPDLSKSDGCFRSYAWVKPSEVLARTISWKKPSVQEGLQMLGLI